MACQAPLATTAPKAPSTRASLGDASLLGLVERVKLDDRDALNELTRLIRPHVERQLARYPVSDDDRLDLVQSTLLQVVRRIRSFRGDSSGVTSTGRWSASKGATAGRRPGTAVGDVRSASR